MVCPPDLTNFIQLYSGNVLMVGVYLVVQDEQIITHVYLQLSPTRVEYSIMLPFLKNKYNLTNFTSNIKTGMDNSLVVGAGASGAHLTCNHRAHFCLPSTHCTWPCARSDSCSPMADKNNQLMVHCFVYSTQLKYNSPFTSSCITL
jgi:hypothetical protein